ncbi:hypothetical protein M153_7880003578 [Pseudoloma neurophilia]|uniref:Uncharacterized protein n=1 Tax=Pseudoloma neurophilia TaxID=146866 RepID=A0A0R0LWI4_9MICR|nr:hypothetical protein M153_7880003578 [Pseudoloma neurophilia]
MMIQSRRSTEYDECDKSDAHKLKMFFLQCYFSFNNFKVYYLISLMILK